MGNPFCFAGGIFATLLFLNSLCEKNNEKAKVHALCSSIQWGLFYWTIIK